MTARPAGPAKSGSTKHSILFAACLALVMALAACAAPAAAPVEAPAADADVAASSGEPTSGGTISWAFIQKPRSLDPNVWTGRSDNDVMRQIFDSLVYSPSAGEYVPWLAESWQISDDGTVYTFKLREDVIFHDGTPLNAEAVKATWDRMVDPATASLRVGDLGPYDFSEVVDEYTIALHLTEPFAPLMANLSSTPLSPGSPAAFAQYGENYAQNPVGTGPFMFDKWDGNDLYLVRNPDYNWPPQGFEHVGPAYVDSIVIREVREPATRMVTLQTGEANVTHYPVLDELASLEQEGFVANRADAPGFTKSMPLNTQRAPTDDLLVRQALLYGIDRQQVIDLVQAGTNNVGYGPLTAVTFGYDPAVQERYPYDPEQAAALLEEAGWVDSDGDGIREKDGENLKLDMIMFDSSSNKALAELVQALVTELGFEAVLDVTPYDAFAERVTTGDFNTAEMNWTSLDPHLVIFNMFHSSQVDGGGQFNRSRIADPALDALIEQGGRETDSAARANIYAEIQQYVLDNALILPIWDNSFITLTAPEVKGLQFDAETRPIFQSVWLDQ